MKLQGKFISVGRSMGMEKQRRKDSIKQRLGQVNGRKNDFTRKANCTKLHWEKSPFKQLKAKVLLYIQFNQNSPPQLFSIPQKFVTIVTL